MQLLRILLLTFVLSLGVACSSSIPNSDEKGQEGSYLRAMESWFERYDKTMSCFDFSDCVDLQGQLERDILPPPSLKAKHSELQRVFAVYVDSVRLINVVEPMEQARWRKQGVGATASCSHPDKFHYESREFYSACASAQSANEVWIPVYVEWAIRIQKEFWEERANK
jgi:hypothetical protein